MPNLIRLLKAAPFATRDMGATPPYSLRIDPDRENGLISPGALMLGHLQPLLREDAVERLGELSDVTWNIVMRKLVWVVDRP